MGDFDEKRCEDRHEEERRYNDLLNTSRDKEMELLRDLLISQIETLRAEMPKCDNDISSQKISLVRVISVTGAIIIWLSSIFGSYVMFDNALRKESVSTENRITVIEQTQKRILEECQIK